MESGRQKEFYDAVFKTLQVYFSHKFFLKGGAVSPETVRAAVPAAGHEQIFEKLRRVFDDCEMVRYALRGAGKEKMREDFVQTREIIDYFERYL